MNNKLKDKAITKNVVQLSQEKIKKVKEITQNATPIIKEKIANTTKVVKDTASKATEKIKFNLTEEEMKKILANIYTSSINGISKVSVPIEDLVDDYLKHNPDVETAAKALINNSIIKCGTSGFVSSFGGFTSMIATLPANITSVMYVQLRMCCAIAKMGGYDIHSDQVQTLIYACLTGNAAKEILKSSGVKFANKLGVKMVERIPFKTIKAINQKVGFRFITKFGETGIINLGTAIPVVGGFVGGGIDVASTKVIGKNAYNLFIKGEIPTDNSTSDDLIMDASFEEIQDIDTKMLNNALKKQH